VSNGSVFSARSSGTRHGPIAISTCSSSFDHLMGLSFYCEDLFARRVEIVTPNSLSPYLGPRILAELEYVVA